LFISQFHGFDAVRLPDGSATNVSFFVREISNVRLKKAEDGGPLRPEGKGPLRQNQSH
jgi:hypothetical protein